MSELHEVFAQYVRAGRPSTARAVSSALKLSTSKGYRLSDQLKAAGWLISLDELELDQSSPDSYVANPRAMPLVVNFARPGIEVFLAFIDVEYGANPDLVSSWWDRVVLSGKANLRPLVSWEGFDRVDPYSSISVALWGLADLDDPFAEVRVRDVQRRMGAILSVVGGFEPFLQEIYSRGNDERVRRLIHSSIPLEKELRDLAPLALSGRPVVDLPVLAMQARLSAVAIFREAQWIWEQAMSSRRLREDALRYGERTSALVLPMFDAPGVFTKHSALRDLAEILKRRYEDLDESREILPAPWSSGDALLAEQMRDCALRLQGLCSEIRSLPALRGPDDHIKGAAGWPLDLVELDQYFGSPVEGETVGAYEGRVASLKSYDFGRVPRGGVEVWFHPEPMPNFVQERWEKLHVSVGDLLAGDVISAIKGQELWSSVLVAEVSPDVLKLTYGDSELVPFGRLWFTSAEDAFAVYRDTGKHKRKTLPIPTH